MSAVSANREPLVKLLLDHLADAHATNSSGQTALHYAVRLIPISNFIRSASICSMIAS